MNFIEALSRNARGHANPISLALNAATVIIGLTLIFFNPKFLPVSGLVIFAGYLIVIQLIHLAVFGTNPIGMVLGALVVIASAVVLKFSLGNASGFFVQNWQMAIGGLTVLYLAREVSD